MDLPSHNKIRLLPMQLVFVLPYVFLTIVTVGLVGYVVLSNGQNAVNEVAHQMRSELVWRVKTRIESSLDVPHQINHVNESILEQKLVNLASAKDLQQYFLGMVKNYPTITSIYFGNTSGGLAGSGREGPGGEYYTYSTENFQAGTFTKYSVDASGKAASLLTTVPNFDARTRPWYINAAGKTSAGWSQIYILFTSQDMAIAASTPVYDANQQLLGVLSVDIFLAQISSYLQTIDLPGDGEIFIVEPNGLLVATSTGEKMFVDGNNDGVMERVQADKSTSPMVSRAAEYLKSKYGRDYANLPWLEYQLEFDMNGSRQFLQMLPLEDPYGLRWMIVVVVPESSFMSEINTSKRSTAYITILGMLVSILVSIFIAQKISRRIHWLGVQAESIARGEWIEGIQATSGINELRKLEISFAWMQSQLRKTLDSLTSEITERKQAEVALRESEIKFRSVIEQSQEGFVLINEQGLVVEWNRGIQQITGIPAPEAVGQPIWDLQYRIMLPERRQDANMALLKARTLAGFQERQAPWLNSSNRGEILCTDGHRKFVQMSTYGVLVGEKFMIGGSMHDITEERQALLEKETLLRELYHRTKNNMQVISSLLALQQDYTANQEVIALVEEMRGRINSMAMVHEKLYQSRNLSSIDMSEYIRDLADLLRKSYAFSDEVNMRYEMDSVFVLIDTAIPCGLMVNELVSNALKYGFPAGRSGEIVITLKNTTEQIVSLTISDNGVGFPPGFDPRSHGKLGTETIFALGEAQLGGKVEFFSNNGVTCSIVFDNNSYTPRV